MSAEGRGYLWPVMLTLLAIALIAGGFFWLSQSSLLAVEAIEINGNHMLSDEQVMEIVGPRLYGQSLLKYSYDDAGDALGDLPFVENVDIKRDFPHTLRIEIREYRPVTAYAGDNGDNYFLSDDTRVLSISQEPDTTLPVLRTGEPCQADVGDNMECDDVSAGVDFIISVPLNLNQVFNQVSVTGGVIDASTLSGIEVHFGTMDEHAYKFEVLRQLIARSMAAGEQVIIDVSVPDRPVIRSKNQPLVDDDGEDEDEVEPEADDAGVEDPEALEEEVILDEGFEPLEEDVWVE